jgi:hypothetical protein
VPAFAPRISPRLLEAIVRLDDRSVPIAETCRRVGREAERLGLPRPSYQRVRVLVHEAAQASARPQHVVRPRRRGLPGAPPEALVDQLSGVGVPVLRR